MSMFNDKGSKWAAGIAALLFGKQLWDEVGARFSSQTPAARPFTPTPMPEHVRAQLEANLWAKAPMGPGAAPQEWVSGESLPAGNTAYQVPGEWRSGEEDPPEWVSGYDLLDSAIDSTYLRGFTPVNPASDPGGPVSSSSRPAPVVATKGMKADPQARPAKPTKPGAVLDANDARARSRRYSQDFRDPRDNRAGLLPLGSPFQEFWNSPGFNDEYGRQSLRETDAEWRRAEAEKRREQEARLWPKKSGRK